ncbi:hypothetical protein [Escherichia coli]|uniref:hypothetical protein n=1 Tax=Escherichia coli TaxID=562 RepID=UPI00210F14F5|nr:hypothetical protein [Escherichia coli]
MSVLQACMVGDGMKNLPDDYFLDADDELVAFLEKQGEDCIREIHQSNALNKENGQKLLSILIAGVGSSFLLLTQRSGFDYLSAGMSVFLFYWAFCAAYLVRRVLVVRSRSLASSTPYALYHDGYKGFTEDDYSVFESKGFSAKHSTLNALVALSDNKILNVVRAYCKNLNLLYFKKYRMTL